MIRHSNSSFFVRILILISAAIVGIILASETALYLNLQRHYDRSTRQLQYSLISQARVTTDTLLQQAEKLIVSLATREALVRFSSGGMRLTDYERFRRVVDVLNLLVTGSVGEYVHSLYLYNQTSDRVLTSEGMMDLGYFADSVFAESALGSSAKLRWLTTREYAGAGVPVISFVAPVPLTGTGASVLILNLDARFFLRNYQALIEEPGTELQLVDSQGRPFASTGSVPAIDKDELDRIISSNTYTSIAIENTVWSVGASPSEYTGWHYVAFSRTDRGAQISAAVVRSAVAVVAVFLLLAIILSLVVARAIYRPVKHLKETIDHMEAEFTATGTRTDEDEQEEEKGELRQIERRFLASLGRNLEYQERYRRNSELLKEKFLWDVVTGRLDRQSIQQGLSTHGITIGEGQLAVLLAAYPTPLMDREHLKTHFYDHIIQYIERQATSDTHVFAKFMDTSQVIVCLHGMHAHRFDEFATRLHAHLTKPFPFEFQVSVGVAVPSSDELHLSYQGAVRLLAYGWLYPGTHVLRTNHRDGQAEIEYLRSESTVAEIASALEKGTMPAVREGVSELFDHTSSNASFAYRHAKVTQVTDLLLNHIVTRLEPDFFFNESENPWQLLAEMDSAERLFEWIESVITRMEDYYARTQAEYHSRHVQAAIGYLEEHYRESISVQMVADAIDIAPTYLSTVFKKEARVSFARYLLDLRLATARELLESTDTPIHLVAAKSGFGNKQTINRAFKKECSCTPTEYREMHFRNR